MATRLSVEDLLQRCQEAIQNAEHQYEVSSLQEHYNDNEYTQAMFDLEAAYNELAKLALHANAQQREQLHRMRLQLQQAQNKMTLQLQ